MQLPGFGFSWSNLLGTVLIKADVLLLLPLLVRKSRYKSARLSYSFSCHLEMAAYGKLALSYPISLYILVALQTTAALVLHGQPDSSINTPQIIARSEQSFIVEAYTGHGAP